MSSPLDRVPLDSVGYALIAHDADSILDDLGHLFDRPDWMKDALCLEHPEVDFLPGSGKPVAPARAVCAACLVKGECLAFALEQDHSAGVWGGTSERERLKMKRAHGQHAA